MPKSKTLAMSSRYTYSLVAFVSCLTTWCVASGLHPFTFKEKAAFVVQLRRHLSFASVMLPSTTCMPCGRHHFNNVSCFDVPPEEIFVLKKELHVHSIRTTSPKTELTCDGIMRTNDVICKAKGINSSEVVLGILPSNVEHTKAYVSNLNCYMFCERPPPPGFSGGPPPFPRDNRSIVQLLPVEDPSLNHRGDREAEASTQRVPDSRHVSPTARLPFAGAGDGYAAELQRSRHLSLPPPIEAVLKLVSWLLFLDGDSGPDLEALLSAADVGCNCRLVVLSAADGAVTEVYLAQSASVVGKAHLGRWDGERLHWHAKGRFERATDLRGITMSCLAVENWPLSQIRKIKGRMKVDGVIPTLWTSLGKYLNFSTKCYLTKTTTDDDLENKIFEYGVDVGLTGVIAALETKERSSVTTKLFKTWVFMVTRRRGSQAEHWEGFLRPFSGGLWVTLFTVVAALLLTLWPLRYLDRQPDAHFTLIAAFLQQVPGGVHHKVWFRILLVAAHLTTLVLVSGYSASLVSALASGRGQVIEDYGTMAASRRYHLHLVQGTKETSLLTGELKNIQMLPAPPGSPRQLSNVQGFLSHMHPSYEHALVEVCRYDTSVVAMHWSRLYALWRTAPCPLVMVPASQMHVDVVIPMRKDTPYLEIINYSIGKLRQGGFFARYFANASHLRKRPWCRYESVAIDNVCVVLYFYMAAVLGSLVVLILEKWASSSCCRRTSAHSRLNSVPPHR